MSVILQGFHGVLGHIDDILTLGSDLTEPNDHLSGVMKQIHGVGLTINPEKYGSEFAKSELKFLEHLIGHDEIMALYDKTVTISEMKPLKNISELRRFLVREVFT